MAASHRTIPTSSTKQSVMSGHISPLPLPAPNGLLRPLRRACDDQNWFTTCPVRFRANRLKNFFPTDSHRERQIVYVKGDQLKVAKPMPGAMSI